MAKIIPLKKKGSSVRKKAVHESTLVRVRSGTADLLSNLRGKYEGAHGERSVDLVVRGMWRDICDLQREVSVLKIEVESLTKKEVVDDGVRS